MKIVLGVIIGWNMVDLVGKLILSFTKTESIITALGAFIDASIYSVSIIVLALAALKILNKSAS